MKLILIQNILAALIFFVSPAQGMNSAVWKSPKAVMGASTLTSILFLKAKSETETKKEKALAYLAHLELELSKLPVCEMVDMHDPKNHGKQGSCTAQELGQLYTMKKTMHRALEELKTVTPEKDMPDYVALHSRINRNLDSHYVYSK